MPLYGTPTFLSSSVSSTSSDSPHWQANLLHEEHLSENSEQALPPSMLSSVCLRTAMGKALGLLESFRVMVDLRWVQLRRRRARQRCVI